VSGSLQEAQRGWCIKLWEWSLSCNRDPRGLELLGTWTISQRKSSRGWVEPAQERGYMDCKQLSHRGEAPQILELKSWHHVSWILDMELQDLEIAPLDFDLVLVLFLFSMSPFFPLGMRRFTLWNCTLKLYDLFVSFLHDSHLKRLWTWAFFFFFFCGTGAWTRGLLHLEPLHQHLVKGFFQDQVSRNYLPGWFLTTILLIFTYWVARITGVSHRCPAWTWPFEQGWHSQDYGNSWRWTECILHYDTDMSLLRAKSRMLRFDIKYSPKKSPMSGVWSLANCTIRGASRIFRR
jgi:hypothetical protein